MRRTRFMSVLAIAFAGLLVTGAGAAAAASAPAAAGSTANIMIYGVTPTGLTGTRSFPG
jgi:hypothetical protein